MRTIFEYLYRDAGNFKSFGALAFDGLLTPRDEMLIRSKLESEEFFIAEQIGVPSLYGQLYQWSAGPIATDHCWHEIVGFRRVDITSEGSECAGSVAELIARFSAVTRWDGALSSHFALPARFPSSDFG